MLNEITIKLIFSCEENCMKIEKVKINEIKENDQNLSSMMETTKLIQEQMKTLGSVNVDNKELDDQYYYGFKYSVV